MKLVVTGGRGRLARAIGHLKPDACLYGRDRLDIRDPEAIRRVIGKEEPDAIINCAAMADVDGCERSPDLAFEINGEAPGLLAQICLAHAVRLIHVSTDYVFDGNDWDAYPTQAVTGPVQVYGQSKCAGEAAAIAFGAQIARASWLFDAEDGSFPDRLFTWATNGTVRMAQDQVSRPTSTRLAAFQLLSLLTDGPKEGIVHLGAGPKASRYDYAQSFMAAWRHLGIQLGQVEPGFLREFPSLAPRPMRTVLALDENQTNSQDWRDDVDAVAAAIAKRRRA
jgi:dTDP-4-dehydrorhamnose reductase